MGNINKIWRIEMLKRKYKKKKNSNYRLFELPEKLLKWNFKLFSLIEEKKYKTLLCQFNNPRYLTVKHNRGFVPCSAYDIPHDEHNIILWNTRTA